MRKCIRAFEDVVDFLLTLRKWLEKLHSDFQLPDGHSCKDAFEAAKKNCLSVKSFTERDRTCKGHPGVQAAFRCDAV